jgi:hypothetical protein
MMEAYNRKHRVRKGGDVLQGASKVEASWGGAGDNWVN